MFTEDDLRTMLKEFLQRSTESELLEFKEAKTKYDRDKLGQYFSALSNEANLKSKSSAWLVFGVRNELPREIVGTGFCKSRPSLESLKHEIATQTNGVTFQEIHELTYSGKRVLLFQVPSAPRGIPTSWKGHYYGRDGESLVPLSITELESIRSQGGGIDWSAKVCTDATIDDLDSQALEIARSKFSNKNSGKWLHHEMDKWNTQTFLDKASLARQGGITHTAILLLGKAEASHHINPHPAQVTWKLEGEEEAYEHFGPPFLVSVNEVYRKIRNVKFRLQPFNQLIPVELAKYDQRIVLEALNNCIAHQDYRLCERVVIVERPDRIQLSNAGGFFDGTIEEYVLHDRMPASYRNLFLSKAMVSLDMIDTLGMGIRRMFVEQRKRFFPMPEYDLADPNRVRMTIYGRLINENYSRILMEKEDLPLSVVLELDKVQKGLKISKESAKRLKREKLIEGRYPNIFVSARIAVATEDRAQYIKNRAFDDSYYETMILEFIDKYGSASRKDVDSLILEKLPAVLDAKQKKNKISNLLSKMKGKGLIVNKGSDRTSKWEKTSS